MMGEPPKLYTLAEATDVLRRQLHAELEAGTHCPTCDQYAKRYHRPLTSAMAYGLILIGRYQMQRDVQVSRENWVHVENYLKNHPDIPSSIRGDFAKLLHWGLIEKAWGKRADGSTRNGYYRVTPKGYDFIHGRVTVPSHAVLYNGELDELAGKQIGIRDALRKQFDYNELVHDLSLPADPKPQTPPTTGQLFNTDELKVTPPRRTDPR